MGLVEIATGKSSEFVFRLSVSDDSAYWLSRAESRRACCCSACSLRSSPRKFWRQHSGKSWSRPTWLACSIVVIKVVAIPRAFFVLGQDS